ncbi:MAG: LysR family transcriptional regulator [Roseateles sp.]
MDRIDQYRLFQRIASCGSFSLAADQLGLPRPTVSTALQQLERRLGTRLLHRTTRRVSLTPDGDALLERVQSLLEELDDLEQRFKPAATSLSGRLRVDVPSRIARRLLAPAMPGLLQAHPGLSIDLGSSDRMVDLAQEGIDCALRVGQVRGAGLVARPLGHFTLINCASPAYLTVHGEPTEPADLAGHFAVHYLSTSGVRASRWEWQQDGEEHSMPVAGRVSANNVESYIALALAGLGLIQVPAFDVREHLEQGDLVEVMPRYRPAPMPVHLVVQGRQHLSRRVRAFAQWVETVLQSHLDAA